MDLSDWHMWWKRRGHRDLYRLLLLWWDPLDVKDVPEAQDEYTGYSGTLGRMLREGTSTTEVTDFLAEAERDMGIQPNRDVDELVAGKVMRWFEDEMRAQESPG